MGYTDGKAIVVTRRGNDDDRAVINSDASLVWAEHAAYGRTISVSLCRQAGILSSISAGVLGLIPDRTQRRVQLPMNFIYSSHEVPIHCCYDCFITFLK